MFTPQPMPHRDMNSQPFPAGRSEYDEWGDNAATNTARAYHGAYKDAPPSWHKPYSAPVPPRQGLSAAASAALKAHDERAEQQGTATARAKERPERLSPTRATGDDPAALRRVPPERLAAVEQETLQQLAGSLIALCEELIVIGTPAGEAPVIPARAARAPPPPPRRPAAGAPPLQMAKLSAPPAAEKPRGVPPLQLGPPPHAEKPGGGMAPAVAEKPRAVPPLQLAPPAHEEKPRGGMPPLQMAKLSLPRRDEAEDVAPSGRAQASCQGGSSEANGGQLNSERGGALATPQDGELTERRRVTMSAHNEVEEQRIAGGEVTREEAIDRPGRQRGSESPRSSATALMSPRSRYTLESPRYKAQLEALQSLQSVAEAPSPSPAPSPAPAPAPAPAPSEEAAVEALRPPPVQVGASEEEIVPPRQPTRPPIFTNASASRSSPSSPSASRRSPPSPLAASASRRASLALQLTDLPDLSELRLSQEPPSQRCSSYRASTDSTGRQRRPRSYSSDSLRIPDPPEPLSFSPTPRRSGWSAPSPGGSVVCTTRDTRSDSGGDERSCSVRSSASWSAASREWRDT